MAGEVANSRCLEVEDPAAGRPARVGLFIREPRTVIASVRNARYP
jgi:hypothetical protein